MVATALWLAFIAGSALPRYTVHGVSLATAMNEAKTIDWVVMRDDANNVRITIDLGQVPGWCVLPDRLWEVRNEIRRRDAAPAR